MKISTITIVAVMLMVTVSTVSAQEWNDFGGGQYVINAKTGNIPIGKGWSVMSTLCHFTMPSIGVTQDYVYLGVSKGYFTPYLGFVGNWMGRDLPYLGTYVDVPLGKGITSNTEFDVMFRDRIRDFYWWQGLEIGGTFKNHFACIGLQAETVKQLETDTQYGVHGGYANVGLAYYGGHHGWNVRSSYTLMFSL
jgi:hypothetical protein